MDRMWNGSKVVSSSFHRTVPGTSFTYSSVSRLGHKVGRYARSFRINHSGSIFVHFRVEDLEEGLFPPNYCTPFRALRQVDVVNRPYL